MIKNILCIAMMASAASAWSQQKELAITIINEQLDKEFDSRLFYIDSVIDNRANRESIGQVMVGITGAKRKAITNKELAITLYDYYTYALPPKPNQTPVTVQVNNFWLGETLTFSESKLVMQIAVDYFHNGKMVYQSQLSLDTLAVDVTGLYDEMVRKAIKQSLSHFNNSQWMATLHTATEMNRATANALDTTEIRQTAVVDSPIAELTNVNRNVFAVGYQIGGFSLIGFEYEFRIDDYVGVNLGLGFAGYTIGAKLHTSPKKQSPFFNISYKDGGFGKINTFGLEFGKPVRFSRENDFAFHFQVGLGSIVNIDDDFAETLFGDEKVPNLMPTIGVGFSW